MNYLILLGVLLASLFTGTVVSAETAASRSEFGATNSMLAEASYQRGVELYRTGRLDEAHNLFRGFVIRHYDAPQLNRALLYLSRILMDLGRHSDALLYLDRIPAEEQGEEANYIRGISLIITGRTAEGVEILGSLINAPLFAEDQKRLLAHLAKGTAELGQPVQALYFAYRLSQLDDNSADSLTTAHQILKENLSVDDLEEAAFMYNGTPIGLDALTQLAWRAFSRGDRATAQRLVDVVLADASRFPYRGDASQLLDRMNGESWLRSDVIGVILPLTGKFAPYGEAAKNGLELALSLHNSLNDRQLRLVYKDSQADPELAARAVTELANHERAIAIIGPLSGVASDAAAQQAQQVGIPMLTLSPKDGLPEIGPYIFRNSLTSRLQVRTLARYAVLDLGYTAFGVLYPENSFGPQFAELFAEEVRSLGGLVVESQHYPENATDFSTQLKRMSVEEQKIELTEAELLEDLFTPDITFAPVTFNALFIPDTPKRAALILPQVRYYGMEELPVFGINSWNNAAFLKQAGQYADGAVFPDGFFLDSEYSFVREFVSLFYETFQRDPVQLEAQAFDVAGMLLTVLGSGSTFSREQVRDTLLTLRNYPGVTGATSVTPTGDVDKDLFLLKVTNGTIRQVR